MKSSQLDVKIIRHLLGLELPALRIGVQDQARKKRSVPLNCSATRTISLEIAAVNFAISYPDSFSLQEYGPSYTTFLNSVQSALIDVDIALTLTHMPDTDGMKTVFDSGQAWSMFQKDDTFYLKYMSPESKKPFWVTEITADFAKATVYCSEEFIQDNNGRKTLLNPVGYPLDQIILMHYLSLREGALIHAAGIGISNKGYIFAGRSGAGKTTISRQFAVRNYQSMLSDDRIIMRKIDKTCWIFGTPWPGEGSIAVNKSAPLAGIFFLSHGDANRIEKISPGSALEHLLPVVSVPWYDAERMTGVLSFCEELISHIPTYRLLFRPETEVVNVLEEFLSH
jgi:hypothetical protein